MALFQPPRLTSLFTAQLPSTLGYTKVTVAGDLTNRRRLTVTWPVQAGAVRYIVYASTSPAFRRKYQEVPRTQTTLSFQFPAILPEDFMWYFWISYINPRGREIFIQDEPGYYVANSAFQKDPIDPVIARDITHDGDELYRIEEMRRRHLFILQNDGEDFYLHIRRWTGQKCVHLTNEPGQQGRMTPMATTDYNQVEQEFDPAEAGEIEKDEAKDPGYHGEFQCLKCFGTSVAGGYLPKILIKIRYGNLPKRTITYQEQGLFFAQNINSWTIWHPQLKELDVLVRVRTGERFLVKDVGHSSMRGITLHQEFNAIFQERSSAIYAITDERILDALKAESSFDVASWDWAVWA